MSIKIIAQLHPFKTDLTTIQRDTAPLSELYQSLGVTSDIKNARMMIEDRAVTDYNEVPKDGSTVYIKVVPAGNNKDAGKGMGWAGGLLIGIGAVVSIWCAPVGAALIGSGVGLLAGGVAMYNIKIPKIGGNSDNEALDQSPSIRGAHNQTNQWGPVPILLGRHLLYPINAATPYTTVALDMAGNTGDYYEQDQYLSQLYCAGYNNMSIDLSTIKIGDSKITDLSYTKNINSILNGTDPWIWLEIIQNGAASRIFPNVCKEVQLNLVVKHGQPVTRTTVANTTRIIIDFRLPSGLGKYDKKGKLGTTDFKYKVEYKLAGSPESVYMTLKEATISAGRLKTMQWRVEANVPAGQYDVRVTRVTADAADANTINQFQWISLKSILANRPVRAERAAKLTIIALKVKATNLIQGYVDQLNFIAQSVMPVYSGSGSGASSWAGTAATSNPAACYKYALQGQVNTSPMDNNSIDWPSLEAWYQWCASHNYTCNAYIADKITLRQLLYQIASTARAEFTKVNNKIGVVQDIAKATHVQLFTPRNSKGFEATKLFADIPEAMDMQFINANAGYVDDQRTVYDVTGGYGDGTGGTTEAKKNQTVKLWGVTDPSQAYLIGKYMYAVTYLRPWVYSFTVDIEYLLAGRGSLVRLSHDVAMRGSAWGRINSRILEDGVVTGFALDELVTMEAGNSYVIRIRKKDNTTILLPVATIEGTSGEVHLNTTMIASTAPDTGDLFAFGLSEQETSDVLITKVEPLDDMKARITAVDYSPEIFGVDSADYVIPPYEPKLTVGGIMDTGSPDFNPSKVPATIEDLNNVLKSLYEGEQEYIPADLTALDVIAEENGLRLIPELVQEGVASGIKCIYQINRGDGVWHDISCANNYYSFARSVDGYPEKETLDTWYIRAKAVNQYGKESSSWRTATINTDGYGTWLVQIPEVTARSSKRSLYITMKQPPNVNVYGNVRYKVQICSLCDMTAPGNLSTATWYEPNVAANPYLSETAYRGTAGGYRLAVSEFAISVPLTGQNNTKIVEGIAVEDPAPVDTQYWFKIIPTSADTGVDGSPYITDGASGRVGPLLAKATAAADIVKAWAKDPTTGEKTELPGALHADNIYTENLAAISAVFAQIRDSLEGRPDNIWDLESGEFRVGNERYKEDQGLDDAQFIHFISGFLTIKLNNLIVSTLGAFIKGALSAIPKTERPETHTIRHYITEKLSLLQRLVNGSWQTTTGISWQGIEAPRLYKNGTLVIGNTEDGGNNGTSFGYPFLSSLSKVYHFDGNLNDQNGTSIITVSGTASYEDEASTKPINTIPPFVSLYSTPKVLFGQFSLTLPLGTISQCSITFAFKYKDNSGQQLLDLTMGGDRLRLCQQLPEPAYNTPGPDEPDYNDTASGGVYYNDPSTDTAAKLIHTAEGTNPEEIIISNNNFLPDQWYRISIVVTSNAIDLYLDSTRYTFTRFWLGGSWPAQLVINPGKAVVALDELMYDTTYVMTQAEIADYNAAQLPWGEISSDESWLLFNAKDPTKVKSNCFYRKDEVEALLLSKWPVGSIYTTTVNTNPGTFLGGVWVAFGQGRVLIGAGKVTDARNETATFVAGATGGEMNHQLTIGEMPSHEHPVYTGSDSGELRPSGITLPKIPPTYYESPARPGTWTPGLSRGGDAAHNNMPPYIVVYFWKRTE